MAGRLRLVRSKLAFCCALCAVVLLLTPLIRGAIIAQSLPIIVKETFGDVVPRSLPDAPARPKPIVLADLFNGSIPTVIPETRTFKPGLTLDLYRRRDLLEDLAIVIVVHGGYWQTGDSKQIPAVNHYLARRGYAVAAINYRKAPANPFPAARDDIIAAMDFLKAHAKELSLDPDRIVLLGRSAGGHLALVTAYGKRDPAVCGVVSLYAPTDMEWSWANPGNPLVINAHKWLQEFLGGTPDEKNAVYKQASPVPLADKLAPPTLLFHGGRDELIWPRQSERLEEKLAEVQVNHLLVRLGWADHGFDANLWGPAGQIYLYVLERFLAAVTDQKI